QPHLRGDLGVHTLKPPARAVPEGGRGRVGAAAGDPSAPVREWPQRGRGGGGLTARIRIRTVARTQFIWVVALFPRLGRISRRRRTLDRRVETGERRAG